MANRKMILRIFFDDAKNPHVEAPIGDFFGVMHGEDAYDINTPFISVKQYSGYNCYFEMPFARNARIELETGEEASTCYIQIDWHRYPDQQMQETRRFCARWRKENPTKRYGSDFLMLDAMGQGQLIGFFYGLRLIDNVDRWSHAGADNIYIDGQGDYPAYIRGIGGEDTFGTSYGGAHHPPETHLDAGIPYYEHEDIGEARRVQRLVGYRFFTKDAIPFRESIHMRFASMQNNICSMVYWYQNGEPVEFVKMPGWEALLPDTPLPGGQMDVLAHETGAWRLSKVLSNQGNAAIAESLKTPLDNLTLSDDWEVYPAVHGFVDYNLSDRPHVYGVGVHHQPAARKAQALFSVDEDTEAYLQVAFDDHAVVHVNQDQPIDLGNHTSFRSCEIPIKLVAGENLIQLTLSNTTGTNNGGWAFAFKLKSNSGMILHPSAVHSDE
ncbi:glycoside hydrolase family 172 protein [Bremerella sp. JC770]|uniref:glycoside hydrolase family 172 protein n=1 Tax=Bremerella sp. JC770 TaxID=3232137 RepID=UPI00345A6D7E